MTFKELLSQPLKVIYRHTVVICMVVLIIPAATFYYIDIKAIMQSQKVGMSDPRLWRLKIMGVTLTRFYPLCSPWS